MRETVKRALCAGAILLFAIGLCRAGRFKYQDAEQAFREEGRKQLAALGLTQGAAKAKYPTPEISMVTAPCLQPGATGELVVRGKFPTGSKFILQNDNLQIVNETLAAGQYRATVKAAPGVGPQNASLMVISPVTGITAGYSNAASIGGKYQWDLAVSNGWKVQARSNGGSCGSEGKAYSMEFFKAGQAAPFEKRSATLSHDQWSAENYSFSVAEADVMGGETANMETLVRKLSDPKTTDAERNRLMAQMQQMQEQLQAKVAQMVDPANMAKAEAKRAEFGCQHLWLAETGGSVKGRLQCSPKVGNLTFTGTMKYLGGN